MIIFIYFHIVECHGNILTPYRMLTDSNQLTNHPSIHVVERSGSSACWSDKVSHHISWRRWLRGWWANQWWACSRPMSAELAPGEISCPAVIMHVKYSTQKLCVQFWTGSFHCGAKLFNIMCCVLNSKFHSFLQQNWILARLFYIKFYRWLCVISY